MEIIEDIKGRTGMPDAVICRAMRVPEFDLGAVEAPEEGKSPVPQSTGSQEGGAV